MNRSGDLQKSDKVSGDYLEIIIHVNDFKNKIYTTWKSFIMGIAIKIILFYDANQNWCKMQSI